MMLLFLPMRAQDVDSLYHVFEQSSGEAAYRAALAIDEAIGKEPNFDATTDKAEVKVRLLRTMILYFYGADDFEHVISYSEIGIEHYNKIGDLYNLAGCYMTLANAYQRLGQYDKAIDSYNRCCEVMDEIGGEMAEVNKRYVLNNIAEIHLAMDEFDQAEAMYLKCVEMLGKVHEDDTISNLDRATYSQNLAEVYVAQSRFDEAVVSAERSLDLSRRYLDEPDKLIYRMLTLSKAYGQTGREREGKALLDEALRLAEEEGELFLEAQIHLQRGDYAEAITMAEEHHYDVLLQEALEVGYQELSDTDPERALRYFERSVAMKDSIFNETQQQLIRDYQVRYAMQEKEHELAMQQQRNKWSMIVVVVLLFLAVVLVVLLLIGFRLARIRKKRNEELTRLNETKDRLISIVSHDVRTPVEAISTVLGQLCTYYDNTPENDRKASLMMLKSSSDALNDRLLNILQWVKQVLAQGRPDPVEFRVREVVEDCLRNQASPIEMKSLKLMDEVDPDLTVCADINVVSIVLQNLVSNAIKFSYPHGEIRIKSETDNNLVWLVVEDHGMGIGEKKLEKLFHFLSSPSTGTDGETGTGIGLFVSKRLLDKIGGEIRLESAKGEGTTVRFSFHRR